MINSKNLALMDGIMGGITQTDEWEERQIGDPIITAVDDRWEAAMKQAELYSPRNSTMNCVNYMRIKRPPWRMLESCLGFM